MSSQVYFDIDGLGRAVHLGDAAYELALYAENAELSVVDLDDLDRRAVIFAGTTGIADWIRGRASSAGTHRIVNAEVTPGQLRFVEECEFADGESDVYVYRAEISGGQIQRCLVSKRHLAVEDGPFAVPPPVPDQGTMVDDEPPRSPLSRHRPTTSERVGNRGLAGHFLG